MSQYLFIPEPNRPEHLPTPDFPVIIAINGRPFEAMEKIYIDMETGHIFLDGVLSGVFRGDVVIERLWGKMQLM